LKFGVIAQTPKFIEKTESRNKEDTIHTAIVRGGAGDSMDHSMDSFIRQFKADGRSNNFEASIKNISLN